MDMLGYKIWKKSRSGRRIEKLIEEYERNSLNGFRESEDGQRILKLKNNPLNTPANKVITKMQREQPALYDALTMWFDPKMEGITQDDIANWFDYPDNLGTLNWNLTSYKKAMTNLSGKPGDLYMISQSKDLPLPTVMEDGRVKMNDGKCSLMVDQLKTKKDCDTVFWYMNYELSDDYLQSASTATITFCPWIGTSYLYITDIDANVGNGNVTAGFSITYFRTSTDTDEYIYQYPRIYGWCNTTAPNSITVTASLSTDSKNYVKANLPNRPCWTTRYKNSDTSVDYDRRKWSCCWGNNNGELDLHIYQKSIGNASISGSLSDQLIDSPFYLSLCDRKTDYSFTAGTGYRPTGNCIFGWFISFNRPLTEEEIAWVEKNMYSTKLEDIPYRPYNLWQ